MSSEEFQIPICTPQPRVALHIPFPAVVQMPGPESPPFSAPKFFTPPSSLPATPPHVLPTIAKIEFFTIESKVEQDMANNLRDDPLAFELWDQLQFDLSTARNLERMAQEY